MIVYTCPKCGADLREVCLPTYPPQYRKECWNCGWKSDTEQEEIVRIPYVEESKKDSSPSITWMYNDKSVTYVPPSCQNCPNHPTNGGSGICQCILGGNTVICSTFTGE